MKKPNWREWSHIPEVYLWQACALSMNIDPHSIPFDRFDNTWIPETHNQEIKSEFAMRLRVLEANQYGPYFSVCASNEMRLSEFASWAETVVRWENLPQQLLNLVQAPNTQAAVPAMQPVAEVSVETEKGRAIEIESSSDVPGKMPRTAIGKLAIKAAWQIECQTSRAASRDVVMQRLQMWADEGTDADVLMQSNKQRRAVEWVTSKGKPKTYDIEACGKALFAWRKSRV